MLSPSRLLLLKDLLEAKLDLIYIPVALPPEPESLGAVFAPLRLTILGLASLTLLLLLALLLVHDEHTCGSLLESRPFGDSGVPPTGRGDGSICGLCFTRSLRVCQWRREQW
jgi:hypothetical protein